jgi:hypothetical protein
MDGTAKGDVAVAGGRLPPRQREALELHELHGLSYDELALRLGTSRDSVAQLIGHARINLYDELYGTTLASVAPTPDCERALGLIAAREDGELDDPSAEDWLDSHLEACGRCRRGVEEMHEANLAYWASAPEGAVAAPLPSGAPSPRRRTALALAAGAALLLFAGAATAFVRNDSPSPDEPAAGIAERSKSPTREAKARGGRGNRPEAKERQAKGARQKAAPSDASGAGGAPAAPAPPTTSGIPVAVPGAGGPLGDRGGGSANQPSGKTAVDPPRRTSAPKPRPVPAATSPTPSAAPAPEPVAAPPPAEEPSEEPPRRREPPGKPASHPHK